MSPVTLTVGLSLPMPLTVAVTLLACRNETFALDSVTEPSKPPSAMPTSNAPSTSVAPLGPMPNVPAALPAIWAPSIASVDEPLSVTCAPADSNATEPATVTLPLSLPSSTCCLANLSAASASATNFRSGMSTSSLPPL